MRIESKGMSLAGRRKRNEDAHCIESGLNLFAVADGVGGHDAGDLASHLAIASIAEFIEHVDGGPVSWPFAMRTDRTFAENMVEAAVDQAHRCVSEVRDDKKNNMGSTLSALVFRHGHAIIGHIGDSRVYRLRDGELVQLTRDHSLYADLIEKGVEIGPGFQFHHVITQALGMKGNPVADIRREKVRHGDTYLLCTDGLSNSLDDEHIIDALENHSAEDACSQLIDGAYEAGSQDNITAVVVRVED